MKTAIANGLKKTSFAVVAICAALTASAQTFSFSTTKRGPLLGGHHYGIFYEEINHAGDGGLYAELIRNRSFEDAGSPDHWQPLGNATLSISTSTPMNQWQTRYLKMVMKGEDDGTRNGGFWGINVEKGKEYKLSFWVRTLDRWNGTFRVSLDRWDGTSLGEAFVPVKEAADTEWTKYTATIKATGDDAFGWFGIRGSKAGTVYLDMVSLFPPTFKNRENGMREDLAKMLQNLHPTFMRFPGGCYIEGGNRYQWKNTIGPVEERWGLYNSHWGYPVSNGMGFHEFLQFCEDIEAEPLFVVNIGIGHGWSVDYQNVGDFIQEALDALEYANGPVDSKWGSIRAKMGHPEPFNLRMLEIGNENYNFNMGDNSDQSDHYPERYYQFYKAIKAQWPDVVCIGNVESWGTDSPSWRNPYPVDLVDEHYYRSPDWFASRYNFYDKYSRTSHGVYCGEYAVTQDFGGGNGNLRTALGEAIFMAGMEVNSDVVKMASYAPIFCNEANGATQWVPDMLHYNSSACFGTPSYWAQQMMAAHVGYQNLTWTEDGNLHDVTGGDLALSSWGTTVKYDNVKITDSNGNVVYFADFIDENDYAGRWKANGGAWVLEDGALVQSDAAMEGACNVLNVPTGDCTIELDATKLSGNEGFLIAFAYQDQSNYTWWNIGGWGNTKHAIEQCVSGGKTTLGSAAGTIKTGTTYHLKVVRAGNKAKCYIDGKLIHDVELESGRQMYLCASISKDDSEAIVKIINYRGEGHDVTLQFDDAAIAGDAHTYVMTSASNMDQNTMDEPEKVVPVEGVASKGLEDSKMQYRVNPYSLNVLRIPLKDVQTIQSPSVQVPEPVFCLDFDRNMVAERTNIISGEMRGGARLVSFDDGNVALYTGRSNESGDVEFTESSAREMARVVNTHNFSVSMNVMIQEPDNFGSFCWAFALGSGTDNYFAVVSAPNNGNWYAEAMDGGAKSLTVNSHSGLYQQKWHNIVYTQQEREAKIYVDGLCLGSRTASAVANLPENGLKAYLAHSLYAADVNMTGTWMDDITFYDKALSADEIVYGGLLEKAMGKSTKSGGLAELNCAYEELVRLRDAASSLSKTDLSAEIKAANAAIAEYKAVRTDTEKAVEMLVEPVEALKNAIAEHRMKNLDSIVEKGVCIDVTSLLKNADFISGKEGWKGTDFTAAPGTVAEQYWKVSNNWQTLENMPAGIYEMTIRGFYRNGSKEGAYRAHVAGKEELLAEYYLATEDEEASAPFMSLYDSSTSYVYYNYPDNVGDADKAFHTGKVFLNSPVSLELAAPGALTVGMRKDTYAPHDWVCYDDVRLYLYPTEATGIERVDADRIKIGDLGVFDLQGRPVTTPRKGVYIIDGVKVLRK